MCLFEEFLIIDVIYPDIFVLSRLRSNNWFNAEESDLAADWAKFKTLHEKFSSGLKKFHSGIEKKTIKGGWKTVVYMLINSRLNS